MAYNTLAVILQHRDWRDDDKLITVYTQDLGKLNLAARGIKKIKSKMAGHIEPFFLSALTIAPGKNYDHLAGALVEQSFFRIRQSYEKMVCLSGLMKFIDDLIKTHHPDKRIFNLLKELLTDFDQAENNGSFIGLYLLQSAFILKLISLLGLQPELYFCLKCRKRVKQGKVFFNSYKGGLICPACGAKEDMTISIDAVKIFRLLLSKPLSFWLNKKISVKYLTEINQVLGSFLKYHLEQPAVALDWLLAKIKQPQLK